MLHFFKHKKYLIFTCIIIFRPGVVFELFFVIILVYRGIYIYTRAYSRSNLYTMGNFKLSKGTLESPRCNYSTKDSYQGKAKIIGMSDEETKKIDEHDNAIPKKEKKKTKEIPNITMDNNLQTATGGKRHKASASKRTPDPLPPRAKEEQPKTQSLNKKVYKPKPQDIDKKTTNK